MARVNYFTLSFKVKLILASQQLARGNQPRAFLLAQCYLIRSFTRIVQARTLCMYFLANFPHTRTYVRICSYSNRLIENTQATKQNTLYCLNSGYKGSRLFNYAYTELFKTYVNVIEQPDYVVFYFHGNSQFSVFRRARHEWKYVSIVLSFDD